MSKLNKLRGEYSHVPLSIEKKQPTNELNKIYNTDYKNRILITSKEQRVSSG
jgi:hypothetical protein